MTTTDTWMAMAIITRATTTMSMFSMIRPVRSSGFPFSGVADTISEKLLSFGIKARSTAVIR